MNRKEEKSVYSVFVLKRDGDHIEVLQEDNYDEAFKAWNKLTQQWAECVKETKPFMITSPIVTAFDPNLIYEITVRPVVETTSNNNHNPYQRAMKQNGFANTIGNSRLLSDVQDGGYL